MAAADSNITLPTDGTGKRIRTRTGMNRATDTTTHQEIHTVAGPDGDMAGVTAYGFLQASGEATQRFYDPFDGAALDLTQWNAATVSGSGAAVTVGSGALTLTAGTLINSYAYVTSIPTFKPPIPGFSQGSWFLQFESGTTAALNTNTARFWGFATGPAAPTTAAAALTDAIGFEIWTDGKMYAVLWNAGTRTAVADLSSTGTGISASTMPSDGNAHRYLVQYRTDRIYWFIDGTLVATLSGLGTAATGVAQQILPMRHQVVNNAATTGTVTYKSLGSVAADTARNGVQLADGTLPWVTSTIKRGSTAPVAADTSQVVSLHPSSTLPAGTNAIGGVMQIAPLKATYSASVNALAPAATPTDIFTITGSATKTVKVTKVQIDATATAAAVIAVLVAKRSSANSAGTSTAPTRVPLDSAFAAATATVLAYTANPTLGTLVGYIRQEKLVVSTTTSSGETLLIQWGDATGAPIVLRGTAEVLAINLNAVTLTGGSINLFVEFTEE